MRMSETIEVVCFSVLKVRIGFPRGVIDAHSFTRAWMISEPALFGSLVPQLCGMLHPTPW